jgi:hypothetical protein
MKTDSKFRSSLLIILIVVIGISYVVNQSSRNPSELEASEPGLNKASQVVPKKKAVTAAEEKPQVTLTIDGYDPDSKSIIPRINLWNDYETRARVVGQVSHGEKVVLVKRVGDGVLVETQMGVQGWLTYWFIKEYGK